jgi:hypothetical protein
MTHVRPVSKLKSFVVGASSSIPKNSYLKNNIKGRQFCFCTLTSHMAKIKAQQTMNMFRFRRIRKLLLERPRFEVHIMRSNHMKKVWMELIGR